MREGDHAQAGGLFSELVSRFGRGPLLRGRGPRTAVVTDTASGLPEAFVRANSDLLTVVPMPVTIDTQVYVEGVDDVMTELSLGLAMGHKVTTSRPAPGQFLRALEAAVAAGAEQIVVVCISSRLSGTVDAALWAAERVDADVRVVDSLSVGLGEGFAVMAAVEASRARLPIQDVVAAASSARDARVWFCVPSLEQLRRGGRIGAAASVIGTLLSVKPILTVDASGAIVASEKARTMPRAIAHLIELGIDQAGDDPSQVLVGVHHFGAAEEAAAVAEALAPFTSSPVIVTPVPAVLGAHTGAGAIALVVRTPGGVRPAAPGH